MQTIKTALLAVGMTLASPMMAQAQSTLRIGLAEDPDILDPSLARTYVGRIVFSSICDKLFDINEKLEVIPQLALSRETASDGLSVTIKLRPGVKFHDGEPLDAEAAKYSIERHMTIQGSFRKPELSSVDRVEIVDPLTIKLILKAPFSPLVAQLTDRAGMMVSPKAAKAAGDKFGLSPVCAGPYKFVERVQQDRIVVEKFADYWNKQNVSIDKIIYRPIPDSTVRLANLKSGQLDLIERALATDIKEIQATPKLKLATALELGYQGITLNLGKGDKSKGPLGQDKRVRQAFDAAIDRAAINEVVFNGNFVPGNQWISPANPYYQETVPVPTRDVAKAKKLLAEAGVKLPVTIDLMVPNNPETRAVSELIQGMTAEAGFDVKIRVTEFATSLNEAEQGNFQAYILRWSGRTDPDGNLYTFVKTGSPQNYSFYTNSDLDKHLDESRAKDGIAVRKAIYTGITKTLLDDLPVIYLYHQRHLIAHTDKLTGYVQAPDGMIRVVGLKLTP